jgi:alpha-galactosidase
MRCVALLLGVSLICLSAHAASRWQLDYNLERGTANILLDGKVLFSNVYAEIKSPQPITSANEARRVVAQHPVQDSFGSGTEFDIESSRPDGTRITQFFWFYDQADYFLTQVKWSGKDGVTANFMAPLVSHTPVKLFASEGNRALQVPFDNDKWIRYDAFPFGSNVTSCEVSAFYDNESRHGLVVGSIDHDTWKTAVKSTTSAGSLDNLEAFGGYTSDATRDVLPHGNVSGKTIASPRIFAGYFGDWRKGMETFAKVNALVASPRPWTGGVPFGWNSWGKLQFKISFQKAMEVSDFFATELQPHNFEDGRIVYIGLDAGWSKFTDDELKTFVNHCHANHQEAGIYFTPFADFGRGRTIVEGSTNHYNDIYLRAHGEKQKIDTGVAIDPTHPGARARIKYNIERFKALGFKYLKADFMAQGALEGDHYDKTVTTGLQAYNQGMKFLDECLGTNMYLNLAISPLFPTQYADSRRIACDAWGDISKVEYTLNAVTYGWWLGNLYDYNDPDHIVLGGYTEGENRARVTSAVITGLCLSGDDFSRAGDMEGKEKAKRFLTNADVDALGRIQKSFRPVEGDTDDHASTMFVYDDSQHFYLAAFNYGKTETSITVPFDRLGLKVQGLIRAKELWSGQVAEIRSPMRIHIPPADAVLYKFDK